MKKILFFCICLLSFPMMEAQQIDREKVVVEVGTGTWCPSCPAVVHILEDMKAAGNEIAVIKYHINDPYQNTESTTRRDYYDFPWYPTTYYDSNHIGYDDWATPGVHEAYYQDRINTMSSFSMAIDVDVVDENGISGTAIISMVDPYASSQLVLHLVITESDIPEIWQGETEVDDVERTMFPNANGTALDFSSTDTIEVPFDIDFEAEWVFENLNFVFFVQDNATQEVVQGNYEEVISMVLSSSDFSQEKGVVYPVPATDYVKIVSLDNSFIQNIVVTDISGKVVLNQSTYNDVLSIESLQSGVYLMQYTDNGISKRAKFIKR